MDFVWTIALAAATFLGLEGYVSNLSLWLQDEDALGAATALLGNTYPEAAAVVASTTEVVRSVTETAEAF